MRPSLAPLLFASVAAGCASYRITIEPPPFDLAARAAHARGPLAVSLQSTYAPYVDGDLSRTDLYPRDRELGRQDLERYRQALAATQQFAAVTLGGPGQGLHCALTVVSGREPAQPGRRWLSLLLTLGQLSHEQREIVRLEAVVSAPGRAPASYRFEGRVTTDAVGADDVQTRRPYSLCGPENELARALVSHLAKDGWLESAGGAR